MPPGRASNNKRPAETSISDGDRTWSATTVARSSKVARNDRPVEDFSNVVKNKLQSYTRTGQACDRCKVRKIRCDALSGGCSHCVNLSLDCYVTDRVTGRTERRGYLQELEEEKNGMLTRINDLEKLLAERGVEVKSWKQVSWAEYPVQAKHLDPSDQPKDPESWSHSGSLWYKASDPNSRRPLSISPQGLQILLRSRKRQHLGVGHDTNPLSSVKGSHLTILGATIETNNVEGPDVDEPPNDGKLDQPDAPPLYNKSVEAFRRTCLKEQPPPEVDLPPRDDAFTYVEWYFLTVHSYLPVLHEPTFMRLLARVYDEPDFRPTAPEICCIHTVLAIMYLNYGLRNWHDLDHRAKLNTLSNRHYHFVVSKVYELVSWRTMEGVQALALLATHARAFPKPGCVLQVVTLAMNKALDLELHKSQLEPGQSTNLHNELCKRTWWVIALLAVALNGRRGRPMPISVNDFDVDFPEPIHDDLLSVHGVDTSRDLECPFHYGIALYKLVPIWIDMYANIYALRRDESDYEGLVAALDQALDGWMEALPESLKHMNRSTHHPDHQGAMSLRVHYLESRLCMHHPSVAPPEDKNLQEKYTRVCEQVGREMLSAASALRKLNALDTTWYTLALYLACAFCMLAASWERRTEVTWEELVALTADMKEWMLIVNDISSLLGIEKTFPKEVRQILDRTLTWIEHDMNEVEKRKGIGMSSLPPATSKRSSHNASELATRPALEIPDCVKRKVPDAVDFDTGGRYHQGVTEHESAVQQSGRAATPLESYYPGNAGLPGGATYPNLAYTNEAQVQAHLTAPPSYRPYTPLFYDNSNNRHNPRDAAAAASARTGSSAVVGNPIPTPRGGAAAFPNQIPLHGRVAANAVPDSNMLWPTPRRGNPWLDWTAAIVDTQEHYSASMMPVMEENTNGMQQYDAAAASLSSIGGMLGMMNDDPGPVHAVLPHLQWPLMMYDVPYQPEPGH